MGGRGANYKIVGRLKISKRPEYPKGNLRSILEGDTMSKIKLYDKVRIKSKNIIGFVVDVLNDKEKFIVEKEGNEGPLFFDIDKDDLEVIE